MTIPDIAETFGDEVAMDAVCSLMNAGFDVVRGLAFNFARPILRGGKMVLSLAQAICVPLLNYAKKAAYDGLDRVELLDLADTLIEIKKEHMAKEDY